MLLEADALDRGIGEIGPAVSLGDRLLLAGDGGPLVGHLEEEDVRELLQVVLVRQPVVSKDVAVGPELLDDAVREIAHGGEPCGSSPEGRTEGAAPPVNLFRNKLGRSNRCAPYEIADSRMMPLPSRRRSPKYNLPS